CGVPYPTLSLRAGSRAASEARTCRASGARRTSRKPAPGTSSATRCTGTCTRSRITITLPVVQFPEGRQVPRPASPRRTTEPVPPALRHERIDIYAFSYGARLAQKYLRAHENRIRAMVLLGTLSAEQNLPASFPLDGEAVMERLTQQCATDARCRTAIPDMTAD